MNFCRFFNNPGFCTNCGNIHDGSFLSANPAWKAADDAKAAKAVGDQK